MSKSLVCLTVVFGLVGAVFAGQSFTDNGTGHLFSTPQNWAQGIVPDDSVTYPGDLTPQWYTDVTMWDSGAICVIDAAHACYGLSIGAFNPNLEVVVQLVKGGDLTIGAWGLNVSRNSHHSKLFMSGGHISTPYINLPNESDAQTGTLVMQDGVIDTGWFNMSPALDAVGVLKLYGGVINVNEWMELDTASASIEVGGGVLLINGDQTGTAGAQGLQGHINSGLIKPAPGYSTLVLDYDVTTPGKTTLAAISDLDPSPADNSQAVSSTSALTWTIPEPNFPGGTVTCDVYFGDPNDKVWSNLNDSATEAAYDAAGGADGNWIASETGLPLLEAGNTTGSVSVSLAEDAEYCWKVDIFDDSADGVPGGEPNLVASYIFEFESVGNFAPAVEAGNNLYSFLESGSRTVTLNGLITEDDGIPVSAIPTWSVDSATTPHEDVPEGGVAGPIPPATYGFGGTENQLNAEFTMTVEGNYVLQLDADDTDLQAVPDTMIIFVRDTACDATIIFPGYEPLIGDLVEDCVIDLSDLAVISGAWLDEHDDLLDDTTEYIPEE